jgi:hypothetical protein
MAAQNKPTGDGPIVLDYVTDLIDGWLLNTFTTKREGLEAVREDLIARAEMGQKKYGTKLRVNNGRRAEVDLYQELMDALMYAMQAKAEGSSRIAAGYTELLLELCRQLAAELDKQ